MSSSVAILGAVRLRSTCDRNPFVYEGPFSLSDAWIYIETAGLDERFFIRSLDAIRGITREEIRILAQKYFCKENLIEVIAGKKV